jgi:hypothetical protein
MADDISVSEAFVPRENYPFSLNAVEREQKIVSMAKQMVMVNNAVDRPGTLSVNPHLKYSTSPVTSSSRQRTMPTLSRDSSSHMLPPCGVPEIIVHRVVPPAVAAAADLNSFRSGYPMGFSEFLDGSDNADVLSTSSTPSALHLNVTPSPPTRLQERRSSFSPFANKPTRMTFFLGDDFGRPSRQKVVTAVSSPLSDARGTPPKFHKEGEGVVTPGESGHSGGDKWYSFIHKTPPSLSKGDLLSPHSPVSSPTQPMRSARSEGKQEGLKKSFYVPPGDKSDTSSSDRHTLVEHHHGIKGKTFRSLIDHKRGERSKKATDDERGA